MFDDMRVPGVTSPVISSPSPSIELRWTPSPGSHTPAPMPRVVVTTQALPSGSTTEMFVVSPTRCRPAATSALASATARSAGAKPAKAAGSVSIVVTVPLRSWRATAR